MTIQKLQFNPTGWHRWNNTHFEPTATGVRVVVELEGRTDPAIATKYMSALVADFADDLSSHELLRRGLKLQSPDSQQELPLSPKRRIVKIDKAQVPVGTIISDTSCSLTGVRKTDPIPYVRRMTRLVCCLLLCLLLFLSTAAQAQLEVHTDFPGGSGEVVSLDAKTQHIVLNPTDHPGHGWRCWWYVKLTGIRAGETVTLDVGNAPWATPDRATFSIDGGKTWQQTEKGERDKRRIVYKLKVDTDSVLVAWGPPFVSSDAKALVEKMAAASKEASAFDLCQTRGGRETPAIRIGAEKGGDKPLVWIEARQHAWESGSSWVAQGFGEWLVSDDAGAVWLRRNCEVVLVPVMDIDNVDIGAGGKSQIPHDHNRDWSDGPHWHAVAAAQALIKKAAENGRLAAFVDLHNPAAETLSPFFFLSPPEIMSDAAKENQTRFLAIAEEEMRGPLRFEGKVSATDSTYDKNWSAISSNWVSQLGTSAISVSLETAWNTPNSTTENYRLVGRQLGQSISRSLKEQAELGKKGKD